MDISHPSVEAGRDEAFATVPPKQHSLSSEEFGLWRNPNHIYVEKREEQWKSGWILKMSSVGVRDRHTRWRSGELRGGE